MPLSCHCKNCCGLPGRIREFMLLIQE
uniref:Uncharacterized protein n=1 Tax=Rhizophora mucronata TaxID=61149 RepID=A0A2P2QYD0_RHIMU